MRGLRNTFKSCLVVMLCCAIIMPMLATAQSDAADETALRLLTEKFLANFQQKNADAVMALWSDQSPDIASSQQSLQQIFGVVNLTKISRLTPLRSVVSALQVSQK